jgi:outer membrane protein TolC
MSLPPATLAPPANLPSDLLESSKNWTLSHLIDLALRLSPETRTTWAVARSAAAALGEKRAAYYPTIELDANGFRIKGAAAGGKISFEQTSFGPTVLLDYLLVDFGGRGASVEEARQTLIAADWQHNWRIQDIVLGVQQTYVAYVAAKALLEAQQANLNEARTNLEAAEARHAAGVATIADVLQAKTAMSQSQLVLDTIQGQIQTIRGALATAVGIPANTPFDVEAPAYDLSIERIQKDVNLLIEEAQQKRPDLAAARSLAAAAGSHITKVRSEDRLSLSFSGQAGRVWYTGSEPFQDTYSLGLFLRIPLFTGFASKYKVLQAQADADRSQAQLDSLRQQVVYQVWTSYYGLQTAAQKVNTTADLVESATQSNEVALGRYKAGVGSIIDLLVAQRELSLARAQQITAKAEWFLSLAQLARDTGVLWLGTEAPKLAAPPTNDTTRGQP